MESRQSDVFPSILGIAAKKMGEDAIFAGINSLLAIVFAGSFLSLAMGNFALAIQISTLAKSSVYLTKIGVQSYRDYYRTHPIGGTIYKIRSIPAKGIIVAKNLDSKTLNKIPLPLPENENIPISKLFTTTSNIHNVRKISPSDVYNSLFELYNEGDNFICNICSNEITILCGTQIGHSGFCSKNPNRYIEWCDDCNVDLLRFPHKPDCKRARLNKQSD